VGIEGWLSRLVQQVYIYVLISQVIELLVLDLLTSSTHVIDS
jgi:hypothetical protein